MEAERVQHTLDLVAVGLVVVVLGYLLINGFGSGSGSGHPGGGPTPTPTATSSAPTPPPGGGCPAGKVAVTIGDESGRIGGNTTAAQLAATVSRTLHVVVSAAEISARNPGLIHNGHTTAGFNGQQCLNY